jgi:hypothetical protein
MTDVANEDVLNRAVEHERPGRRFVDIEGSRWGELILPAPDETPRRQRGGLRALAVTSFSVSLELLGALAGYERAHPGRFRLEAVATDDPINAEARIGLRKRLWRQYTQAERIATEVRTVEAALQAGVPVYTGEIKVEGFRRQLAGWRPDAIIVCGCGQIFDRPIIEAPRCGVYNFHPADLARGHGAGPQPYEDLVARGDPWTCWTLHRITVAIDSGPIVGQSPRIFVGDAEGRVVRDAKLYLDRMMEAVGPMAAILVDELVRRDGPVAQVDFSARFPDDLVARLEAPIL